MSRLGQSLPCIFLPPPLAGEGRGGGLDFQSNEEPIVSVDLRRTQRLVRHRHQPFAFFAGALGDQLLGPDPETLDRRWGDDRNLVAPDFCRLGEDRAQPGAGILCGGDRRRAGVRHGRRPIEEGREVDAAERGRDQTKVGERRVAPADVGWVQKRLAEATTMSLLRQRRSGVGDRDELARLLPRPFEEILVVRQRLERGARFRGDDEDRFLQVDRLLERRDRGRVGGVEHVDVERAFRHPERLAEDLGRQAATAHAH